MPDVWDVETIGEVVPPDEGAAPKPFRLPETITQGNRHEFMRKLLRSQKARGVSFEAAKATIEIENRDRCDPPLEKDQLEYQRWWNEQDRPEFANQQDKRRVDLVCARDVEVVKMEWLWRARLAFGAIALLEGGPERGKSTVLVDLAARVTRGHSFPGETETRAPANVVMLIAEDDIAATVVPRLIAADADLARVYFLAGTRDAKGEIVPFHLSDDCSRLRDKCQAIGKVALVIVDPLVSFMGSRDGRTLNTYNDHEVRKALAPLKTLAEETRAAVVAIRHYRKGKDTDAMEAGGGSVAFAAYFLAVAKNNLVKRQERPAIRYAIVPAAADPDIGCIAWGRSIDRSANDILAAQADADKNNSGKVAEAKAFLEACLASGAWVPTKELLRAAKEQHGLAESTVRRAKDMLPEVRAEQQKSGWGWRWVTAVPADTVG